MAVRADPRLGQGDPTGNGTAALASELFEQHSQLVLAICRRMLADPAEAEDAMQQTFLYAYRSLLAGREPQQPAAWLASIARNECLNRIRARTREPVADRVVSNGDAGSPDALNAAIASEDLRTLGRTIKSLPTQQREALLLHEFCGLRYEEVAAAIGVSESAIGSLLFRARSRLRFLLQRAHALLPVPWLWDLARGPGVKVAALPAVAKVGTAAVAVSLATGTAVVVEREVEAPKKPAPPPARLSAAAAAPTGMLRRTPIEQAVSQEPPARASSPRIVPSTAPAHPRRSRPTKNARKVHPVRPAASDAAPSSTADPTPGTPPAWAGKPHKGSSSTRSRPVHGSTGGAKTKQQGNDRSSGKAHRSKKAGQPSPRKSAVHGSPNGNGPSSGKKTPPDSAGGSPAPQQQGNASENSASNADHASANAGGEGKGQSGHPKH